VGGARPRARTRRVIEPVRVGGEASLGDEALLAGVSSGSEAHFNVLYARYFGRIYAFVNARAGNRSDAEELTQEVFTAVFRSAGGFGERATPLSWIYGIARNTLLNYLRKRQLERAREAQLASRTIAPPAPDWSFTPEEQYRQDRIGEELERRLELLAPWQLDVFRLRHVDDLPIEEIARRTTRSADAVRSGLYRAKRLMFEAADLAEDEE
jgi:RNA polymerase sigma-70 factor (ECF subfamily)